jgi:hypothetical protein
MTGLHQIINKKITVKKHIVMTSMNRLIKANETIRILFNNHYNMWQQMIIYKIKLLAGEMENNLLRII